MGAVDNAVNAVKAPIIAANPEYGDHYASNTMAGLTRDMWSDYLKRFAPQEIYLRDQIMSGERMSNGLARANSAVTTQFDVARGNIARKREGLGLSPVMNDAERRKMDMSEGLARAHALNTTRQAVDDSNMQIIAGVGGVSS